MKANTADNLLYSEISALFGHHQGSFLLQQTGTNADTHRNYIDRETLKYTALNGCLYKVPPLTAQGTPWKRREKESKSLRQ